ncbi:MAG: FixH family protein [Rhodothermales bacterium]
MKTRNQFLILPVVFGLLLTGCGQEEMAAFQTVSSGSYQITLLAPGGVLKSGDNTIAMQVSQNGQPVDVQQAELMFFMPQMGAMPYMEMHAQFAQPADAANVDGTIKFSMGGSWNARLQVTTPGGPASGTFQIHVEERE